MAKYLKPQTPLQHQSGDYIYPITTIDQVLMDNGERLNANIINIQLDGAPEDNINFGINADTLGGQKPEYYATAEDLVALNDSKLSMELLWENASPTSECDELTVDNLDLSIYSHVLIEFMYSTNLQWVIGQLCKVGNTNVIPASMTKNYYRMFSVTTSKVWFEIAHVYNTYAAQSVEIKTHLIPYRVYGVKGVSV